MKHTVKLKQNKDFVKLYHSGKKIVSPYMILYVMKNRRGYNRLGLTAGKKIGNATVRNRARRIMTAAYRQSEEILPVGFDIVIVALAPIREAKSDQLSAFLMQNGKKRMERLLSEPEKKKPSGHAKNGTRTKSRRNETDEKKVCV